MSRIFHVDLYGTRKHKYETLRASDMASLDWQEIDPNKPFYLFRPQEQDIRGEYEQAWSITDAFLVYVLGFQTHRDALAIDFSRNDLQGRLKTFIVMGEEQARENYNLGVWDIQKAQKNLHANPKWDEVIQDVLYRPFDTRSCFYSSILTDRPRKDLVRHVIDKDNICLGVGRQGSAVNDAEWALLTVSRYSMDANMFRRGGATVLPLWLYPEEGTLEEGEGRQANLNPKFIEALAERLGGETPTPEAIFHYAYAVFHAPTYRERYAPFLKIDFPRLPLPPQGEGGANDDGGEEARATFRALAKLGERLVALHLLEAPELAQHGVKFPVSGDHTVEKMRVGDRYLPPTGSGSTDGSEDGLTVGKPGRVLLNETEYFDNVPPEAWEFRVGGYQPAAKWLDDRAGRALTTGDIDHYRRMIASMRETAALLAEVDAAFLPLIADP